MGEPFPVPIESLTGKEVAAKRWYEYEGKMTSNCVWVTKSGDMDMLYKMGFFGKGMMSKSKPGRDEQLRLFHRKRQRLPDDVRRLILTDIRSKNTVRKRRRREWADLAGISQRTSGSDLVEGTEQFDVIPSESSFSDEESERCTERGDEDVCEATNVTPHKPEDLTATKASDPLSPLDCQREMPRTIPDSQTEDMHDEQIMNDVSTCHTKIRSMPVEDSMDMQAVDSSLVDEEDVQPPTSLIDQEKQSVESEHQDVSKGIQTKRTKKSVKQGPKHKDSTNEYPVKEFLQLSLCEAFFLSYGLGCLRVRNTEDSPLSVTQLWQACVRAQPGFLPSYVAYHHLRSKGWVVRTGEKYGVDFLVYKDGPVFYHSNAAILVQTVDKDTLQPVHDPALPSVPFTWQYLAGLNRINASVGKDLILFHVLKPSALTEEDLSLPDCLGQMAVQEIVLRRWIPDRSQEVHEPFQQWT